jgi:hypothetical protein
MKDDPNATATAGGPDAVRSEFDSLSQALSQARVWPTGSKSDIGWDDPDISILDDTRGEDLPEFPLQVFSKNCGDWVERAAYGAGVTVAHVASPLLGIASSVIGTARRVQASRSWSQPCTIWTAVIGYSGSGKTPGLDSVRIPLASVERGLKDKIAGARQSREAEIEAAKIARTIWKKKLEDTVGAAKADGVVDLRGPRKIELAVQ